MNLVLNFKPDDDKRAMNHVVTLMQLATIKPDDVANAEKDWKENADPAYKNLIDVDVKNG